MRNQFNQNRRKIKKKIEQDSIEVEVEKIDEDQAELRGDIEKKLEEQKSIGEKKVRPKAVVGVKVDKDEYEEMETKPRMDMKIAKPVAPISNSSNIPSLFSSVSPPPPLRIATTGRKIKRLVWDGFFRRTIFLLVIAGLVVSGFFLRDTIKNLDGTKELEKKEKLQKEEGINSLALSVNGEVERELILKCENGEWVKVGTNEASENNNRSEKVFQGKLLIEKIDMGEENKQEQKNEFWLEKDGQKKKLLASEEDSFNFFKDRAVEIMGIKDEKEAKIKVSKIKCQTDNKNANKISDVEFKQELMNYVSENINSLVSKKGSWGAENFFWPTQDENSEEKYVYVEFETLNDNWNDDKVDDKLKEEEFMSYLLLLKVAKKDRKIEVEKVAFLQSSDEDWKTVEGKDIFSGVETGEIYNYEPALKKWVKFN